MNDNIRKCYLCGEPTVNKYCENTSCQVYKDDEHPNIEVIYIKRQKLPRIKDEKGYNTYNIVDKDNITLNFIETKYMKSCIVLLDIENEFYYSETFNKFYKTLNEEERNNLISITTYVLYLTLKQISIIEDRFSYVISDWGKIKMIYNEN